MLYLIDPISVDIPELVADSSAVVPSLVVLDNFYYGNVNHHLILQEISVPIPEIVSTC